MKQSVSLFSNLQNGPSDLWVYVRIEGTRIQKELEQYIARRDISTKVGCSSRLCIPNGSAGKCESVSQVPCLFLNSSRILIFRMF